MSPQRPEDCGNHAASSETKHRIHYFGFDGLREEDDFCSCHSHTARKELNNKCLRVGLYG